MLSGSTIAVSKSDILIACDKAINAISRRRQELFNEVVERQMILPPIKKVSWKQKHFPKLFPLAQEKPLDRSIVEVLVKDYQLGWWNTYKEDDLRTARRLQQFFRVGGEACANLDAHDVEFIDTWLH